MSCPARSIIVVLLVTDDRIINLLSVYTRHYSNIVIVHEQSFNTFALEAALTSMH